MQRVRNESMLKKKFLYRKSKITLKLFLIVETIINKLYL